MNATIVEPSDATGLVCQVGLVRWFDNRPNRQFGFIAKSWDSKECDMFFHMNDCRSLVMHNSHPILRRGLLQDMRAPKQGDLVIYRTTQARKGPKACPWSFLYDYDMVTRWIGGKPLFRLVGFYPVGTSVTFWTGLDRETLFLQYPECRRNLDMIRVCVRNCAMVQNVRIEVLEDPNEDPTTSKMWKPV